ncbi:MAG TPA: tetratricopeptide repeat protein [Flavisolibacter sp.]
MRILLFLVLFFSVCCPSLGQDSVSPQEMQVKLLEQQVNQLREEIKEQKEDNEKLQAAHRENMDKLLESKASEINGRLAIYLGVFIVAVSFLGFMANWLGKKALRSHVDKLAIQQIDVHLQQKLSIPVIDTKLTELAKPIVDNLLGKYGPTLSRLLDDTREQYEKYQRLLQENSKIISQPNVGKEGEQDNTLSEFVDALRHIKDEKDYSASDWLLIGHLEFNKGNYGEAISCCNKAIELEPNGDIAYTNRGLAKSYVGRHEEAMEDHNKAIELNPRNDSAYNGRGFAKIALGEYEEAITENSKAIELNSENFVAYNDRGFAKSKLKRNEEARMDFQEAIRLDHTYANPHKHMAQLLINLGQLREALEEINKAVELKPDYIEAIQLKVEILKLMEDRVS